MGEARRKRILLAKKATEEAAVTRSPVASRHSLYNFWKFSHSSACEAMLAGSFKFSRLSVFRGMEGKWIGDPLEGRTALFQSKRITLNENSPYRNNFRSIDVRGGASVVVENHTEVYSIPSDPLVFCFSMGSFHDLSAKMLDVDPDRYDSCLAIKNPKLFVASLRKTATVENGDRLKDRNHKIFWGKVEYRQMSNDILRSARESPSPFKKDIHFMAQREVRIVIEDGKRIAGDVVFLRSPEAAKQLVQVL